MKKWIGMVSVFGWAVFLSSSAQAGEACSPAGKKAEVKEAACAMEQKADCAVKKAACEAGKQEGCAVKKAACGVEKQEGCAVKKEARGVEAKTGVVQPHPEGAAATLVKEKPGKPQTQCPVMAAPINKKLYVDHDGKRIYVCCRGCVSAVKRNPAAAIEKLEAQGIALEKVKAK